MRRNGCRARRVNTRTERLRHRAKDNTTVLNLQVRSRIERRSILAVCVVDGTNSDYNERIRSSFCLQVICSYAHSIIGLNDILPSFRDISLMCLLQRELS